MDYLPISIRLLDQPCSVIGGGEVATRKVALLLEVGARVTVTAPDLTPALLALAARGDITIHRSAYTADALDQAVLVIAATNAPLVNQQVSDDAKARRVPVNVVDDPERCTFILPAIIDRSPLLVAVSTGGASPVLARLTRARLEAALPAEWGQLAELAGRFRDRVKSAIPASQRRAFWENILQGPIAEQVLAGRFAPAEAALSQAIQDAGRDAETLKNGEIYLIGTGPGAPDLMTFAALRLMQQADVIVHPATLSPAIQNLARRDAQRWEKAADEALDSVRRLAAQGRRVAWLLSGEGFKSVPAELTTLNVRLVPGLPDNARLE